MKRLAFGRLSRAAGALVVLLCAVTTMAAGSTAVGRAGHGADLMAPAGAHGATATQDEALYARVRAALEEVPLIDGHNEVPWQYLQRSTTISMPSTSKATLPSWTRRCTPTSAGCVGAWWGASFGACT